MAHGTGWTSLWMLWTTSTTPGRTGSEMPTPDTAWSLTESIASLGVAFEFQGEQHFRPTQAYPDEDASKTATER